MFEGGVGSQYRRRGALIRSAVGRLTALNVLARALGPIIRAVRLLLLSLWLLFVAFSCLRCGLPLLSTRGFESLLPAFFADSLVRFDSRSRRSHSAVMSTMATVATDD